MNGQNLLGTVDEIAARVGGQVVGDGNRPIFGVAAIEEATDGDLTFLANQKYRSFLETTNAAAVLVDRDTVSEGKNLIQVDQPYW